MPRISTRRSEGRTVSTVRSWSWLFAAISMGVCLLGCQPPPTTDADDVIAYVRNAAVGAQVRRLQPTAQPYVRNVMKAYHAWQETLEPIAKLAHPDALWPNDDDTWRDPEAVSERSEAISEWLDSSETRERRRQQLTDAIQAVPPAFSAEASRISSEVEKLLGGCDMTRLTRTAIQYQSIQASVQMAAPDFDPDKKGLTFRDAALTEEVNLMWKELLEDLSQIASEQREEMDWFLTEGRPLRDAVIQQKRKARRAASNGETLRIVRKLDIDIQYYDKMIESAEKR